MTKLKNLKHELFLKNLIEHKGNLTKAYLKTYPDSSKESARRSASALMTNLDIKARLGEILEEQGLGIIALNSKLKDLTEAEKVIVIEKMVKKVPDNPVRLDALKTAYKLHKLLGSDISLTTDNRQVNIGIQSKEDLDRLEQIVKMMSAIRMDEGGQTGEIKDVESYRVD